MGKGRTQARSLPCAAAGAPGHCGCMAELGPVQPMVASVSLQTTTACTLFYGCFIGDGKRLP